MNDDQRESQPTWVACELSVKIESALCDFAWAMDSEMVTAALRANPHLVQKIADNIEKGNALIARLRSTPTPG